MPRNPNRKNDRARRRPGARRFSPLVAPAAVLVLLLCSTFAIDAELVVFTTGDVLKVSAFEIEQGDILLQLASGGRMKLPMRRVDRILDDEVVELVAPQVPIAPPAFELGFLETHPVPEAPYGVLIHEVAKRYSVNPSLVAAMVHCESAFDPYATSPKGAQGLMQLMPATAERFGVYPDELYDPARNLDAGVRYLAWLVNHFDKDLTKVLAAYNSGEGTVERFQGVPPYRETQDYVRRVYHDLGLAASL